MNSNDYILNYISQKQNKDIKHNVQIAFFNPNAPEGRQTYGIGLDLKPEETSLADFAGQLQGIINSIEEDFSI